MHVCTMGSNELVTFRVDPGNGSLAELKRVPYPDIGKTDRYGAEWEGPACPCHISMDRTGQFILTAFYTAGMVCVHGTTDGIVLAPAIETIQTDHGCHSIQIDPVTNTHCWVPCVAAWAGEGHDPNNSIQSGNRIFQFEFDETTGRLSAAGHAFVPPPSGPTTEPRFGSTHREGDLTNRYGSRPELGPRHVAFHPDGGMLFTSNEQDNSCTAYRINEPCGTLEMLNTISTIPLDDDAISHTSEIRCHPNGKAVFIPNRGHDSIACLAIAVGHAEAPLVGGSLSVAPTSHTPQAIELSPSGEVLWAAGGVENSVTDRITTFRVTDDGRGLEQICELDVGKNPIRMLAVDLPPSPVPAGKL